MKIIIEVPDSTKIHEIQTYADKYLAFLWHLGQHNPAPMEDAAAGEFVEHVGREIISRWLKAISPKLWHHQGRHYYWDILQKNGKWLPVNGDANNRQWTPNKTEGNIEEKKI